MIVSEDFALSGEMEVPGSTTGFATNLMFLARMRLAKRILNVVANLTSDNRTQFVASTGTPFAKQPCHYCIFQK